MRFFLILTILVVVPLSSQARPRSNDAHRVFYQKIHSGDTLISILRRRGFKSQHIKKILSAQVLPNEFQLVPGEIYRLKTKTNFREVSLFHPRQDISYRFWRRGNKSGAEEVKENFRVEIKRIKGKVVGSLIASIERYIKNTWVAYRFLDAYAYDFDLRRKLQKGAAFSFEVEKKYDGKRFIRYGEILKTSIVVNNKPEKRKFVRAPGGGSFVGEGPYHNDRPLFSPVDYMRISSGFQRRRFHPVRKRYRAHLGVDFELPRGKPVYAAQAGRVFKTGKNRGAGRYVGIRHFNGLETYYNHLYKIDPQIRSGSIVKVGQQLGQIGCSGLCTKPHLHFAVKKRGRYVDPIKYLKSYPYQQRKQVLVKN